MRYYKEILSEMLEKTPTSPGPYVYHEWSDEDIMRFWKVHSASLLKYQFYTVEYWTDFLSWARPRLRTPRVIVDIGSGGGNMLAALRKTYPAAAITGVDLSEESLKPAVRRFASDGGITLSVGSVTDIPVPDASVDLLTLTEIMEHLRPETLDAGLAAIAGKLRSGGALLATVPIGERLTFAACPSCGAVYHQWQHMIFEISRGDIKELCRRHGLSAPVFYRPFDRGVPSGGRMARIIKKALILALPRYFLNRLFPKPGTTGFLAVKQ
jgi:ubiquinone/menaquinone biosynthesis C-methylase UbiE